MVRSHFLDEAHRAFFGQREIQLPFIPTHFVCQSICLSVCLALRVYLYASCKSSLWLREFLNNISSCLSHRITSVSLGYSMSFYFPVCLSSCLSAGWEAIFWRTRHYLGSVRLGYLLCQLASIGLSFCLSVGSSCSLLSSLFVDLSVTVSF